MGWINAASKSPESNAARASLDLFSRAFENDPHRFYRVWQTTAPVLHFPANEAWVVLGYDAAVSVLRNTDEFSSSVFAPLTTGLLHASDPPDHTALRRMVTPFFSPSRQTAATASVIRITNATVARFPKKDSFRVLSEFADRIPIAVACEWLGIDLQAAARLLNESVSSATWSFVEPAIAPEGLMADLIQAGGLSSSELAQLAAFFLTAAVTTSRDFIWLSLRGLASRPEAAKSAVKTPDQTGQIIEELLRLEPPVHALIRSTRVDTEIAGVSIPKDAMVWISLAAANRDPGRFERPDEILSGRTGPRHLAFGNGPHFCLGSHLGKIIGEVALNAVLPLVDIPKFCDTAPSSKFERDRGLPITWRLEEWEIPIVMQ